MVEMGMCQQQKISGRRFKTKRLGILLHKLMSTLIHSTVDKDTLARAFDQMTGSRNVFISTVE